MGRPLIDLTGQVFGRLTVQYRADRESPPRWLCLCECGATTTVRGGNLTNGKTRSCGCLHSEVSTALGRSTATHGMSRTLTWRKWRGMRARCLSPSDSNYEQYGGRGITICERWQSFDAFLEDMGASPPGMSLDRIDTNGNYEPGNCRWATPTTQTRNRRSTRMLTHRGETRPFAEWAEMHGIRQDTLDMRLHRGWTVERALSTPVRSYNRSR
jgi:hypothetical protein